MLSAIPCKSSSVVKRLSKTSASRGSEGAVLRVQLQTLLGRQGRLAVPVVFRFLPFVADQQITPAAREITSATNIRISIR